MKYGRATEKITAWLFSLIKAPPFISTPNKVIPRQTEGGFVLLQMKKIRDTAKKYMFGLDTRRIF